MIRSILRSPASLLISKKSIQASSLKFSTLTSKDYELNPSIPDFLKPSDLLTPRHVGPIESDLPEMLKVCGVSTLDELLDETIPKHILQNKSDRLVKDGHTVEGQRSETLLLQELKNIAAKNKVLKSYIGCGYYPSIIPNVILRNVLENPVWYTSYTPYQAEISQGRLEALLYYQTMITELTGLEYANASLLDEATAAAESMYLVYNAFNGKKKKFFVSENIFPQTVAVVKTRAWALGIEIVMGCPKSFNFKENQDICGVLMQNPGKYGYVYDYTSIVKDIHDAGSLAIMVGDLLSMTLVKSPGEMDFDVAVGTTQRMGLPMAFGGPHAGYLASKEQFLRKMPGRIIGYSKDSDGRPAFRMALQVREQHIKRERATSNICTAQALLANMSGFYGIYHGPKGLKTISNRIASMGEILKGVLLEQGYSVSGKDQQFFDTIFIESSKDEIQEMKPEFEKNGINLLYTDKQVGISLSEQTTLEDLDQLCNIFGALKKSNKTQWFDYQKAQQKVFNNTVARTSDFMVQKVFNSFHSETQMLRFLQKLSEKDLSLATTMIPLGSCTLKLNSTVSMIPITWPEFTEIHPYADPSQCQGYYEMIDLMEKDLKAITGFDHICFQPNSGSQGEYTGLLVIKKYLQDIGQPQRTVLLIPSTAHGTNPASATLAAFDIVVIKADAKGRIDMDDLKAKVAKNKDKLAGIMITYPSTSGVFEGTVKDIMSLIHENGGQVYMDGANMNALCGFTTPAELGADVCHLNLHKTFGIPHGGGGPGMGPIGIKKHLKPYAPSNWHDMKFSKENHDKSIGSVSSANYGSAGILPISFVYIRGLGKEGIAKSTATAILNANYVLNRLKDHYKILYTGDQGRCGHEFMIDMREFKRVGIKEEDIAKRLMDFGFHAPTMSFPVPGTLMCEPTESEDKEELDKFCDAFIQIRKEIEDVEDGKLDKTNNPLVNSPHSLTHVTSEEWNHPYSREQAAYPLPYLKEKGKFWPASGRIDNTYGDRNLKTKLDKDE